MTPREIARINELLDKSQKVVLISHASPDGDAIGSILAMTAYLRGRGLDPLPMLPDGLPAYYSWMPYSSLVCDADREPDRCREALEQAELIICFDFNGFKRVEGLQEPLEKAKGVKVLIDHHPNPQKGFDHLMSQPSASSAAELVYYFIHALAGTNKEVIDLPMAQAIYVGMMTDTGSFNYNANNPEMYSVIRHLVEIGVDPELMHQRIYNNFSVRRMRFLGNALLNKMVVLPDQAAAYIPLTLSDLQQFKHQKGDTEGLVNYPLSIKGIVFSALLTETSEYVKASFRSISPFDVNVFAKNHFNGGGHIHAAGGKSFQPMTETIQLFESLVKSNYLKQLKDAQKSI